MARQDWIPQSEMQIPGVRLALFTHETTGPLERVHCVDRPTLSMVMSSRWSPPRGTFLPAQQAAVTGKLGPLVLMPARIPLRVVSGGANRRQLLICAFDPKRFASIAEDIDVWDGRALAHCMDIRSLRVQKALERLAEEVRDPGLAADTLIDGLTLVLAIELAREMNQKPQIVRGGLSPRQLQRIKNAVADSEGAAPTVRELARLCDMSPRHVMRAFKQATGMTIMRYAAETRLERAKDLLRRSRAPISDIARALGFQSRSGFTTAFQRATGMTPRDYRSHLQRDDRESDT